LGSSPHLRCKENQYVIGGAVQRVVAVSAKTIAAALSSCEAFTPTAVVTLASKITIKGRRYKRTMPSAQAPSRAETFRKLAS
jgi:hypothetical protein